MSQSLIQSLSHHDIQNMSMSHSFLGQSMILSHNQNMRLSQSLSLSLSHSLSRNTSLSPRLSLILSLSQRLSLGMSWICRPIPTYYWTYQRNHQSTKTRHCHCARLKGLQDSRSPPVSQSTPAPPPDPCMHAAHQSTTSSLY